MASGRMEEAATRTIRFAKDRSLGTLQARDWGITGGWQTLGEALGDVSVPLGKEVRLKVNPEIEPDLSPLAQLELDDLQWIDLSQTTITDSDLAHLENLMLLRRLNLSETAVTDEGMEHLRPLTALKEIRLNKTQITDGGLEHLTFLPKLQNLWLNDTQITDSGIDFLREISSLEILQLPKQVSVGALGSLKLSLPECYINIQK